MRRTLLVLAALAAYPAAADAATLKAPVQQQPAADATLQVPGAFTWRAVKGAATYEVQVAADDAFGSRIGGAITGNTAMTLRKAPADGDYFWRVRGVTAKGKAGKWTKARPFQKRWSERPDLQAPTEGVTLIYPKEPLVLRWSDVENAYKYKLVIATDPSLAHPVYTKAIETSGTSFAVTDALAPGKYYWAVTPTDAQGHSGTQSGVGAFVSSWPATTVGAVTDVNVDTRVFDPELSWNPVAGAASYDVEVNPSVDFAVGSKVCCDDDSIGTTVSPTTLLPNNTYYWRVRAVDVNGNPGPWNDGPNFRKVFDDVLPAIPNLRMRDNLADPAVDLDGGDALLDTENPIVTWDPVAGASSYEVQITPYTTGCDWTQRIVDADERGGATINTSWTPRDATAVDRPGPQSWPGSEEDPGWLLDDETYCVRVLAIAGEDDNNQEVASEFTPMGGDNAPAFHFHAPAAPLPPDLSHPTMTANDYVSPAQGQLSPRVPVFTWKPLADAGSYWIVIARDQAFTNVVEVGYTRRPEYSMRGSLTDETTSYYWAVLPAESTTGSGVFTTAAQNSPRAFDKRSVPPEGSVPAEGADVTGQPQFHWSAAEGAEKYRLQVATDAAFGDPVANITTAATSYTPTATYPVDTVLYWRVRAEDGNGVGLTYSPTRTFRRRLPTPTLASDNPAGGEGIPVLSWTPVQGASSYTMHVDQADGTKKDFTTKSSSFTPTSFYGTGIWRWQVRANFPGSSHSNGPFTALTPFTRAIPAPGGAKAGRTKGRIVMSWNPATMAKQYRIQVSTNSSFQSTVENVTTDLTTWAPDLSKSQYRSGGKLYWRVATVDEGGNSGAWSNGVLTLERKLVISASGKISRRLRSLLLVRVKDAGNRSIGKARVTIKGAGVKLRRKASKTGSVTVWIVPKRKGRITITATHKGYKRGITRLRVG